MQLEVAAGSPISITGLDEAPVLQVAAGQTIAVALAGEQGPAGPPGEAGGALALPAATTLHGHRAIAVDAAGRAVHADAATLSHALATVGITEQSAVEGDTIQITSTGPITHSGWSWTPGPVLLGLDGVLTQTRPAGALYALPVGWGDGDTLTVRISSPIYIGA